MTTCKLHVPLPADVSPVEARLLLAVRLFQEEKVGLGGGAEIAGCTYREFIDELVKRGIPWVTYTEEMYAEDMRWADSFVRENPL